MTEETLVSFGDRKRKERQEQADLNRDKEVKMVMHLIDNALNDEIVVPHELTAHCIHRFSSEGGILLDQSANNKLKYNFQYVDPVK